MKITHPGHVWEKLDNDEFLLKIGASAIGEDGKKHPTGAGLLMFGNEYDIVREFPYYFLDYREEMFEGFRWTDRITSSSGDWSGNVLDFYFRVYNKIQQGLKVPFAIKNGVRVDDTPVHIAIREALANCIANADYYGTRGLVVTKSDGFIQIANPGSFRIEVDAAKSGGISDPRNGVILKMFNLINIGERAGSGIPNIYRVWREQNWQEPVILQLSEPDRTLFILPLSPAEVASSSICEGSAVSQYGIGEKEGESSFFDDNLNKIGENDGGSSYKIGEKEMGLSNEIGEIERGSSSKIVENDGKSANLNVNTTNCDENFNKIGEKEGESSNEIVENDGKSAKKQIKRRMIIDYLTEHSEASANELAEWVHLKPSRARDYLRELVRDGIVIAQGETWSRVYRLKY